MRASMRIDLLAHLHLRWPLRIGLYATIVLGGVTQALLLIERHPTTGAAATVLHGCLLATIAALDGVALVKIVDLPLAQLLASGVLIGILSIIATLIGLVVGSVLVLPSFLFTVDTGFRDPILGWLAVTGASRRRRSP